MKLKIKIDSKIAYFLITEIILIIIVVFGSIKFMKSETKNKELQRQLMEQSEVQGIKKQPPEYNSYKSTAKSEQSRSIKAVALVEEFLNNYYGSDPDPYSKLIKCEKYLSDSSIRKLCPYENDPEEISDELLQKIRNHDITLVSSENSNFTNYVENLDIYYSGDSTKLEKVLAYFTVQTYTANEYRSASTYIFECTIGEKNGNFLITDIILKSPVIFPANTSMDSNTY